mmetsp:Transcript_85556/g.173569  ORF Transcript_85556/g.173569 Transcript_85556/m.173569 type:complete len:631 (+) Transcript_85556:145-2037(+)
MGSSHKFFPSCSSSSNASVAFCFVILMAAVLPVVSLAQMTQDDNGCEGGICPFLNNEEIKDECGLWMGPSPIKEAEKYGFGLGIFTGKDILAGTAIESLFYGHGELVLPIFGAENIYDRRPPLREYIWDEGNLPETAVEYPNQLTALFVPGLAAIAPCTSKNNNLRLGNERGWSASSDDNGVHRATHPHAGAFSYRHNVTYIAVRDIVAGEELTVNCDDDTFDGGAYFLSHYDEAFAKDDRVTCLDKNIRVGPATISSPSLFKEEDRLTSPDDPMGLGVFAKRSLSKGEHIISSPLIPIHRAGLEMVDEDEGFEAKQLMLNYAFGHRDSDLLLLPIGPMVNFINHKRSSGANVEIRWHHVEENGESRDNTEDMKAFHDTELFDVPGDIVAMMHERGLVMDIVALREISEGEEIYLDYGEDWQASWDAHVASFERLRDDVSPEDQWYVSADNYRKETLEGNDAIEASMEARNQNHYRTSGIEQESEPYPDNMDFFCFYHQHDDDTDDHATPEDLSDDEAKEFSWHDHSSHSCLRPCSLLERDTGSDEIGGEPIYTVHLYREDNGRVVSECGISMDYVYSDVPHSSVRLLDLPFTTDVLRPNAFRHEIGVPEGFYPTKWLRKKSPRRMRGRT